MEMRWHTSFQLYTKCGNGQCKPNPLNVGMQCSYLAGVAANAGASNNDSWSTGMPMEGNISYCW